MFACSVAFVKSGSCLSGEKSTAGPDHFGMASKSRSRGKPRDRLIVPVETKPRPPWRDLPFDHLQRFDKHGPGKVQPLDQVRRRRKRHHVGAGLSKYVNSKPAIPQLEQDLRLITNR